MGLFDDVEAYVSAHPGISPEDLRDRLAARRASLENKQKGLTHPDPAVESALAEYVVMDSPNFQKNFLKPAIEFHKQSQGPPKADKPEDKGFLEGAGKYLSPVSMVDGVKRLFSTNPATTAAGMGAGGTPQLLLDAVSSASQGNFGDALRQGVSGMSPMGGAGLDSSLEKMFNGRPREGVGELAGLTGSAALPKLLGAAGGATRGLLSNVPSGTALEAAKVAGRLGMGSPWEKISAVSDGGKLLKKLLTKAAEEKPKGMNPPPVSFPDRPQPVAAPPVTFRDAPTSPQMPAPPVSFGRPNAPVPPPPVAFKGQGAPVAAPPVQFRTTPTAETVAPPPVRFKTEASAKPVMKPPPVTFKTLMEPSEDSPKVTEAVKVAQEAKAVAPTKAEIVTAPKPSASETPLSRHSNGVSGTGDVNLDMEISALVAKINKGTATPKEIARAQQIIEAKR